MSVTKRYHIELEGIPLIAEATRYRGYKGKRERGTGLQLEPDEEPYIELENVYIDIKALMNKGETDLLDFMEAHYDGDDILEKLAEVYPIDDEDGRY
jgi:hypothetical protein